MVNLFAPQKRKEKKPTRYTGLHFLMVGQAFRLNL